MFFNHEVFFNQFKKQIDASLDQSQVDGIEFLLSSFEKYDAFWKSTRQIAYAFATVAHETAGSYQPVEEGYYLGGQRAKNYQKTLRYYPYFGVGFVQLTWLENFAKATKELKKQMPQIVAEFERRTGETFNLVKYPQQAKDSLISFAVMTLGMVQGWFRAGHTLDRYINSTKTDYVLGRYIINGKRKGEQYPDKALEIAAIARKFEKILIISATDAPATKKTSPNVKNNVVEKLPQIIAEQPSTASSDKNNTELPTAQTLPQSVDNSKTVEVAQIVPEKDEKEHSLADKIAETASGIKGWFVALPATIIASITAFWERITSGETNLVYWLIGIGGLITIVYFVALFITKRQREQDAKEVQLQEIELKKERESRAFQLQMLTLKAAADPKMNNITIKPTPIENSDSETK